LLLNRVNKYLEHLAAMMPSDFLAILLSKMNGA